MCTYCMYEMDTVYILYVQDGYCVHIVCALQILSLTQIRIKGKEPTRCHRMWYVLIVQLNMGTFGARNMLRQ
jgi:hypothetical protein